MIHEVHAEEIRAFAVKVLSEHIELDMSGYRIDDALAWDVLLKAASDQHSVEHVCQDLKQSVHPNTMRTALNERFDVSQLQADEARQNQVLAATIPQSLRGQAVEVAIDFHDEPSYVKDAENRHYVCRGEAKAGTTRFWRVATAYVMKAGQRVTVALQYVLPEYSKVAVLETLLQRVQRCGIKVKCLYLDKGFCSGAIIRYLQAQQMKAIIACPIRGKKGGTKALCQGRASYATRYTFSDGTTTDICCVRTIIRDNTDNKKRVKWLLYVTLNVTWQPATVKKRYRRRFGIEASYRQMRQLRLFSTSRNPALRFFFYGLGFLLLNIWTLLHWQGTRHPGTRHMHAEIFPLARFKTFIRRAIEQLRGVIDTVFVFFHPQVLKL